MQILSLHHPRHIETKTLGIRFNNLPVLFTSLPARLYAVGLLCFQCCHPIAVWFNVLLPSRNNSKAFSSMKSFLIVFCIHYFLRILFSLYVSISRNLKDSTCVTVIHVHLIYPFSLKLLKEQKIALSIIVSPNVCVDQWIKN